MKECVEKTFFHLLSQKPHDKFSFPEHASRGSGKGRARLRNSKFQENRRLEKPAGDS